MAKTAGRRARNWAVTFTPLLLMNSTNMRMNLMALSTLDGQESLPYAYAHRPRVKAATSGLPRPTPASNITGQAKAPLRMPNSTKKICMVQAALMVP